MALAPKTVLTYPLDGANRDFTIPFEYLARKFVQVTLIGKDRTILTLNIDYRFTLRTIITLTKNWGPADGYERIEIRRYTSATERLVDFSDGSILRAYDLNTSQVQSLHIAEEGRDVASDTIGVNNDGDLDARGRKIVNLADGVNDGDAVNLRQMRQFDASALNSANKAAQSAAQAAVSQQDVTIRHNDIISRHGDITSKHADTVDKSAVAVQAASNSNVSADWSRKWSSELEDVVVSSGLYSAYHYSRKSQADRVRAENAQRNATTEADRAKREADKLGNMNLLAASIESVYQNDVTWKGNHTVMGGLLYLTGGASQNPRLVWNFSDSASAVSVVFHPGGNWMLQDRNSGQNRLLSDGAGNLVAQGSVSAGGVLSGKGLVSINAVDSAGNSHVWLNDKDGRERALIWAGGDRTLNLRAGEGPAVSIRQNGSLVTSQGIELGGSTNIQPDGNIIADIYLGGSLHQYLTRLNKAVVRSEFSHHLLWQGPQWGVGGTIVLNEDVRNFQRFTSQWSNGWRCTLTGLVELAHYSFGESMYMSPGNATWYQIRFNDLGDGTYRSLTMVSAGGDAVALPHIYGYRKTV